MANRSVTPAPGLRLAAESLDLHSRISPPSIDLQGRIWYKIKGWQRSSVVEQGTHKPLVSGPNPLVATIVYSERDAFKFLRLLNYFKMSQQSYPEYKPAALLLLG
jgi:hypothetical protein